jgi:sugar lactone lactonase YvrE
MPIRAIRRAVLLIACSRLLVAQAPLQYLIANVAGAPLPPVTISALSASIGQPASVVTDTAGSVYFSATQLSAVMRVDPSGNLTRVAGNGQKGFGGDYGPALSAELYAPTGLAFDALGNLYIADLGRVRKVGTDGSIVTLATGFFEIYGIATDGGGNVYVADYGAGMIRRSTPAAQSPPWPVLAVRDSPAMAARR